MHAIRLDHNPWWSSWSSYQTCAKLSWHAWLVRLTHIRQAQPYTLAITIYMNIFKGIILACIITECTCHPSTCLTVSCYPRGSTNWRGSPIWTRGVGKVMAGTIREFRYATPGRGRGVLGMVNFEPCRKPGKRPETSVSSEASGPDETEQQESQGERTLTCTWGVTVRVFM